MVLGIFVGVPAVIGFAIAGTYILKDRRVRRAKPVESLTEEATASTTEALGEELAQPQGEVLVKQGAAKTAEKTLVGAHQKR